MLTDKKDAKATDEYTFQPALASFLFRNIHHPYAATAKLCNPICRKDIFLKHAADKNQRVSKQDEMHDVDIFAYYIFKVL